MYKEKNDFRRFLKRHQGECAFLTHHIQTGIEGLIISIQASNFHRCFPSSLLGGDIDLTVHPSYDAYTHMEIAFLYKGDIIPLVKLIHVAPMLKDLHLESFGGCPTFDYVPIKVIQKIYEKIGFEYVIEFNF